MRWKWLLALVTISISGSADAATIGTWRLAGEMLHARESHTATLLSNGTVLIAGGSDRGQTVAEAEIFDPRTGAFSPTASMVAPRYGHAAVLLIDGRVLIAGGYSTPQGNLQLVEIAEIFDPMRRRFSPAGSVGPGFEPSLLALSDGGAILIGGRCSPGVARFDPTTLAFTTVGPGPQFQYVSSPPALTASGRIVLAGGGYCSGRGIFSISAVSASVDYGRTFSDLGRLTDSRMAHTTTSLGGELLLVTAGVGRDFNPYLKAGTLDSAEIVDASTGTSRLAGSLREARSSHAAALLRTGEVLVTGGVAGDLRPIASTEIFDPLSDAFHSAGPLSVARWSVPIVVTSEQRIFVFGGSNPSGALSSAEEFVPVKMRRRVARSD